MSKCSLLHGGSLRGPPIPSASGRHFHKGIENGGLEFVKAAVGSIIGHGDCLLYDGFFLLPSPGRFSLFEISLLL